MSNGFTNVIVIFTCYWVKKRRSFLLTHLHYRSFRCCFFFSGLSILSVILLFFRTIIYFISSHLTARALHNQMFNSLLRAPVLFFDTNPIGKIEPHSNKTKQNGKRIRFHFDQVVSLIGFPKMFHRLMNNYLMSHIILSM